MKLPSISKCGWFPIDPVGLWFDVPADIVTDDKNVTVTFCWALWWKQFICFYNVTDNQIAVIDSTGGINAVAVVVVDDDSFDTDNDDFVVVFIGIVVDNVAVIVLVLDIVANVDACDSSPLNWLHCNFVLSSFDCFVRKFGYIMTFVCRFTHSELLAF